MEFQIDVPIFLPIVLLLPFPKNEFKTSKAVPAQGLAAFHSLSSRENILELITFFKAIANSSSSSTTISSIFEMFLNTFPQKMINIAVQCLSTDFSSQKGVKL
uniref:Uncharacterized protein n=1 Tax=Glossina pallidipes TaxID=7398 RepID=A0A1A9ZNJ7_GLOPL